MAKITLAGHEIEYENVCKYVLEHCTLCYFQQPLQSTLESRLISFTANTKIFVKKLLIIKMVLVFKHWFTKHIK